MQLYKSTGCQITLVGYLINTCAETQSIVVEQKYLNNSIETSRLLSVQLNVDDFQRVMHFGYAGILLTIMGDAKFSTCEHINIIAEKIDFSYISANSASDAVFQLSKKEQFRSENIDKIKQSMGYQSALYHDAARGVH